MARGAELFDGGDDVTVVRSTTAFSTRPSAPTVLARQVLPDRAQLRALRRGLVPELGIGVAVLGVTAVLVATSSVV